MLRLAISGITGRMGRTVAALAAESSDIQLVGGLVRPGRSVESLALALPRTVYLTSQVQELVDRADVVIDFSHPDVTVQLAHTCAQSNCALVSGTTGLHERQLAALQEAAHNVPVLHASNFSLGIALLQKVLPDLATALEGWDIEILEWHHRHKRDAPSGTALSLARTITQARPSLSFPFRYGRGPGEAPRQPGEIGLHAIRAGGETGRHSVLFATDDEALEVHHSVSSRRAYAAGALLAARRLVAQPPGWYTFTDLLFNGTC